MRGTGWMKVLAGLLLQQMCFGQRQYFADTSIVITRPSSERTQENMKDAATMQWASYERRTIDGHFPTMSTQIRTVPLLTTLSLYTGACIGLHYYQLHSWWSNDRGPFHIQEDWPVDLQVDKFGHFFGAYMMSYATREALLESGFTDGDAHILGAAMGLAYELYVEVEDGFSTQWGFSPTDAYADIAGASYFLAQRYIPVLQNFHEKWTYWPSSFVGTGSIPGQKRTMIDDYQGQSYWWTVDVWNLLPERAQQWYPSWLQFAIGYAAKNYDTVPSDIPKTREIFLGLDYNLLHLIPATHISPLDWLIQSLDNIHFPAPTLQLAPQAKFYFLYPIRFHIGQREL